MRNGPAQDVARLTPSCLTPFPSLDQVTQGGLHLQWRQMDAAAMTSQYPFKGIEGQFFN